MVSGQGILIQHIMGITVVALMAGSLVTLGALIKIEYGANNAPEKDSGKKKSVVER